MSYHIKFIFIKMYRSNGLYYIFDNKNYILKSYSQPMPLYIALFIVFYMYIHIIDGIYLLNFQLLT